VRARPGGALDATRRGARLERVVQHPSLEVELALSGGGDRPPGDRTVLVCSCAPGLVRLSERPRPSPAPDAPLPFAQYLRAHLAGARLRGAAILGGDRQAALRFETREARYVLLLSILGPRSNLYLLDAERRLLLSLRPLEETRRDLARGAPWCSPATPPPPPGEDRFADAPQGALLAAIEVHYAELASGRESEDLRRRLRAALRKHGDGLARKRRRLERDVEGAAGAEQARRLGELLKGVLSEVRPRADHVRARDPVTGESVEIPLDPSLSGSANLERYFKQAKKAERRELRARQELGALDERVAENDARVAALEAASDEDLPALAERPELARLLERYAPVAPRAPGGAGARAKPWKLGGRELATRLVPKRYRTSDGLEVWVGRNDEGNDLLTTRLARGRDLFFHLEGSPGSHVVLRVEGKGEPPQASLLEAAELAVHFSKQRRATRASVHVAAIKDVSKPRGAKPGLVYVHRGRTLQLRRDEGRLARILEARIEE
jgi:predicted ribosome quality control (RQC) complex YloA/Tae2 family protein